MYLIYAILSAEGVVCMHQVSPQEKERALNNAIASVEMEGYRVSKEQKQLCIDVLNGKLTKAEFIKILLERCTA